MCLKGDSIISSDWLKPLNRISSAWTILSKAKRGATDVFTVLLHSGDVSVDETASSQGRHSTIVGFCPQIKLYNRSYIVNDALHNSLICCSDSNFASMSPLCGGKEGIKYPEVTTEEFFQSSQLLSCCWARMNEFKNLSLLLMSTQCQPLHSGGNCAQNVGQRVSFEPCFYYAWLQSS